MKHVLDLEYEVSDTYNESYFGKRPEFEQAERLVDQIRNLIVSHKVSGSYSNTKENKALENIFQKVFGFKKVHILWIDAVVPNAYTICSSFVHRGSTESKYIVKDINKGFYDTRHSDILFVAVYTGLLTETGLSSEEFLGVVLHEVGHNFDYSPYNTVYGVLSRLIFSITPDWKEKYYQQELKKSEFKGQHNFTDDIYKDYLELREKIVIHNKKYEGLFMAATSLIWLPFLPITLGYYGVVNAISTLGGKKSENFADSFATAYGYGNACMAALEKLQKYPNTLKNSNTFTKVMVDISNCTNEMLNGVIEIHGTNQERISLSISKLERDLKTGDFPPEMRADLEKELAKLKALYNKLLSYDKDEWNYVSVTFRRISNFLFKGTNIFHKLFPKNQA